MKYFWLPRWYGVAWLFLIVNGAGLIYQRQKDMAKHLEDPNIALIPITRYFTFRAVIVLGALVLIGLIWSIVVGWSQQIAKKTKRPNVDVTNVDRHYGGTVVGRRLPGRIWDAASEGDMLVKPAGSLFVQLEQRRRSS